MSFVARQLGSSTPVGFPTDVPYIRVIPFPEQAPSPTSLTVTILQWPTGVSFPQNSDSPTFLIIKPDTSDSWSGQNVKVLNDSLHFDVSGVTYSITTGATLSAGTDPTAGSSLSNSSFSPTASGLPTVTSSLTSTPLSATSTTEDPPHQSRVSGGAVAGVAIGCLVAGALIAGLALWFCWRRRRVNRTRLPESSTVALMPLEKGPLAQARSLENGSSPGMGPGIGLPQPLEDQAISGEVSKIGNLIKNHVQSYYHSRVVNAGLIDLDDITALGHHLPVSVGTLSTLLDNTETREAALRFCIAFAVVSRLQSYEISSLSLLPPGICASLRETTTVESSSKDRIYMQARWRVATAELMYPRHVSNAYNSSDPRNASIQSLAHILENILQPFAASRLDNEQRKRNLEEILKRSASFAFTLFSQPSTWGFDWKEEQTVNTSELCIFPALIQQTDEAGETLRPPRYLSEAVSRRLKY